MNDLSFEIRTTLDFFKKLQKDYEEFCLDTTSSRVALNCAMTAWHITDWCYHEFNSFLNASYPKLSLFQKSIKSQCPSLQIMHDITNGSKHYLLTMHKPIIKSTDLYNGEFSNEFSNEFDISILEIELKNETKIYFEDEIKKSVHFWLTYLRETFSLQTSD